MRERVWSRERALKGYRNTVHAVAFSSDGRYVASGGADYKTKVHDVAKAKVLGTKEGGSAHTLAFVDGDQPLAERGPTHAGIVELPQGGQVRLLDVQWEGGAISGDK